MHTSRRAVIDVGTNSIKLLVAEVAAREALGKVVDKVRSLRAWMGVTGEVFYDRERVAIVPMGFCFPGHDPHGGDLPPRRECAPAWRDRLMAAMPAKAPTWIMRSSSRYGLVIARSAASAVRSARASSLWARAKATANSSPLRRAIHRGRSGR